MYEAFKLLIDLCYSERPAEAHARANDGKIQTFCASYFYIPTCVVSFKVNLSPAASAALQILSCTTRFAEPRGLCIPRLRQPVMSLGIATFSPSPVLLSSSASLDVDAWWTVDQPKKMLQIGLQSNYFDLNKVYFEQVGKQNNRLL